MGGGGGYRLTDGMLLHGHYVGGLRNFRQKAVAEGRTGRELNPSDRLQGPADGTVTYVAGSATR